MNASILRSHLGSGCGVFAVILSALLGVSTGCGPEIADEAGEVLGTASDALACACDNPAPFPGLPYRPDVKPQQLDDDITNPLFPAPVGARWVYRGTTPDGRERTVTTVLSQTKTIWRTDARVIHDRNFLNGELIEDTLDFYAQDPRGNVWYLGEKTTAYENGKPVSREGSWRAGVKGALPGVQMMGNPCVGQTYREEYLKGVAEDFGKVLAVGLKVTVQAGTFHGCVKIDDQSTLEPGVHEFKFYCPGVGLTKVVEAGAVTELVSYSIP